MIHKETLSCITEHFNEEYFNIHEFLLRNGDSVGSRNGATKELLNFKTIITNPVKRCVGGNKRNINIFFLLAEALWIFAGRKDVAFLDTYNSKLKNYSDDGKNYHAPYGWRLRNWGVSSDNNFSTISEENKHHFQGLDQLAIAVELLDKNPEDRRVVMQIWNPEFDLDFITKDTPCNDIVMYKIRNGKLYATIGNRSNDLNLGLTTNVFQFSFINEIISKILNVGLGDQVHNSQSLHLYLNEPLTSFLQQNNDPSTLLYNDTNAVSMDFNFAAAEKVSDKFRMVNFHINSILSMLTSKAQGRYKKEDYEQYEASLKEFSRYLYFVYELLSVYCTYKNWFPSISYTLTNGDDIRIRSIQSLHELSINMPDFSDSDYLALSLNFFLSRLSNPKSRQITSQFTVGNY